MSLNLPTVVSFLMLYSLRCGCITILIWTTFRSLFCLVFFMLSVEDVFLLKQPRLLTRQKATLEPDTYLLVYYSHLLMIITEALLFIHMIHFGVGIYSDQSNPLVHYLVCRFLTLLSEVFFLIVLCLSYKILIGWYLGFLFFVVLEFYSFVVVYSYYVDVKEDEDRNKQGY